MATAKKSSAAKGSAKKSSAKKASTTKAPAKKSSAKKTSAKKASTTKSSAKKTSAKKTSAEKPPSRRSVSLPKSGKDPKGGLTPEGRSVYNKATGGNLRPGVRGKTDTPEKMLRKGSFLRRHFANPQGPVADKKREPTRQALEAAAWGEPVPKSRADEKKLARKGSELLTKYHESKGEVKTPGGRWKAAPKQAKSKSATAGEKSKPKAASRTTKKDSSS